MDYSYLFVTRNLEVGGGDIQKTSERVIKITEPQKQTLEYQEIYIFEKDDRRNPEEKEKTFCVRQLLNNLGKKHVRVFLPHIKINFILIK